MPVDYSTSVKSKYKVDVASVATSSKRARCLQREL